MQNTWVQLLLILVPTVLIPLAIWRDPGIRLSLPERIISMLTAILLTISQLIHPGYTAGLLAGGWLIFTSYLVITITRIWRDTENHSSFYQYSRSAALIYLCIGAGWAVIDRFGWRPLDFDPLIVLLTAVHFHYAGFIVNWTAATASKMSGRVNPLLWCTIAGVPLTALGISTSQLNWWPGFELFGVLVMVTGGIFTAIYHFRLAIMLHTGLGIRMLWLTGGLALLAGMILALSYGFRYYFPFSALSIPQMYRWHGSLNSIGFALPVLSGWYYYHLRSGFLPPHQKNGSQ